MTNNTKPRSVSYDDNSTNYRQSTVDNGVVGRADGLLQFSLGGKFKFVAEYEATYFIEKSEDGNSKDRCINIEIDRNITFSEFATLLENGETGVELPELMLSAGEIEAVRALIATEITKSFDNGCREIDYDFEWEIEDKNAVVAYDVFFECVGLSIKVFTDSRVDTYNASNNFEAIVDALDNEGLTDIDSVKKALINGQDDTDSDNYNGVTVWNDDKSLGYRVDRVVALKAVDIEVEYDGVNQSKRIFVPIDKHENIFGRYYD